MTIKTRLKTWLFPVVFAVIFFSCIAIMCSAPTYYGFHENGEFIQVWVTKDKDTAKVAITNENGKRNTKKYPIKEPTNGETDILGSFSNDAYSVAKNGNLRLANGIEIPPQKSMRYSVACIILLTTISIVVCVAVSAK